MIIKASQRAGAKQLSEHLLNGETNEHVHVHELSGFMASDGDLKGALNEIYAQSLANKKIKKFMFSVSINPPKEANASTADFVNAANRAEHLLGLTGQQRAIIFHEKEGRRHAHVVWSRIDENLKAIKLDYFKKELNKLSRELFLEHGWELPKGFQNKQERDLTSFDLSEWQTAKRQELSPKQIKANIQALWGNANNLEDFKQALLKEGFVLAKGNKRSFVLVDMHNDVRSLSRTLSIKAKEVKAKLGDSDTLPSVDEAKLTFTQTHKEAYNSKHAELARHHKAQLTAHQQRIDALVDQHKREREALNTFHAKRQIEERDARQTQHQSGLRRVWQFVTGSYHQLKKRHEAEYQANLARDSQEKEALIQTQLKTRQGLQQPLNLLKEQHQSQMRFLNSRFMQSILALGIKGELTAGFEQKQTHHQKPHRFTQSPELDI